MKASFEFSAVFFVVIWDLPIKQKVTTSNARPMIDEKANETLWFDSYICKNETQIYVQLVIMYHLFQ